MNLVGELFVGESRTKTFSGMLGRFGQKSFPPEEFASSYTYAPKEL